MPAARIAANDEPYSTSRRSPRCHQTRCGMWCTSGCAPVAIEERQTGVSDGKVETARRYVPCAARNESAGALPVSTASSNDRRRQPVDDDEDELLALGQLSRLASCAGPA